MSKLDKMLLQRWSTGDVAAGEELVGRHLPIVRQFIRRQSGDEADDIVQQTFLACMESAHRFRDEATVRTFLTAIAIRQLQAHRRRTRQAHQVAWLDRAEPDDAVASVSPGRMRAREQALENAIYHLPLDLKVVIVMSYWHDMTQSDIAKKLVVPAGTVASRLRRARSKLRELMNAAGEEDDDL